jgi:hypothetical protein
LKTHERGKCGRMRRLDWREKTEKLESG